MLLVFQGMDASGKDGAIRRVFTGVNPQGCRVESFKAPTPDELAHDFLWRIHDAARRAARSAIFNRSHYEDVVAVRVRKLADEKVWRAALRAHRAFEKMLADEGTPVVKVFLHLSRDEQRKRLQERLDDPEKRWKFRAGDLEDRARWDDFTAATRTRPRDVDELRRGTSCRPTTTGRATWSSRRFSSTCSSGSTRSRPSRRSNRQRSIILAVTHVNEGRVYDPWMRETLERERKLDVEGDFTLPKLPGSALATRVFTSTYHDTPARSLSRAGITLRRRLENGKSLWQLKLPREGNGNVRAELEAAGGPAGPPAALRRLLVAHLRNGGLEPVATLRTRRSGVRVEDGSRHVADVTVDGVEILDAGHAAGGFTEIEIELADGEDADLDRLEKILRRAGARRGADTPKVMRVVELDKRVGPAPAAPLVDHLRHYLTLQFAALEAHDPGVRLGSDPEDVHRFRVATRRTRAVIDSIRPLLADEFAPLAGELSWLANVARPRARPGRADPITSSSRWHSSTSTRREAGISSQPLRSSARRDALSCSRQWTRRAISTCSPRSARRST